MFYDIFYKLCKERNETPASVAEKLGFSNSTPTYWKQSKKNPKNKSLIIIANYFNVTVDELLGKENARAAEGDTLSAEEAEAMRLFCALNEENRSKATDYIRFLLSRQEPHP